MIGNQYDLFGTGNIFEITGEQGEYWIITIRSFQGAEVGVRMTKQDLAESVSQSSLIEK